MRGAWPFAASFAGIAGIAGVLAAGCGPPEVKTATAAKPAEISEAEAQRMVGEVAALRGLSPSSPIPVERLSERRFAAAIDAFFVSGPSAPGEGPSRLGPRELLQEQVIGFYDEDTRKVFLRGGGAPISLEMQRVLLAHEIEHALQHQRFGGVHLGALHDEDARLARLALFEGDASLVGVSYLAVREGVPIRRAILRVTLPSRSSSAEQIAKMDTRSTELLRAPTIDRERLLFPYVAGMDFVTALYRAGGFPLLDRAFSRPPATTEQVLHPEKYLAGEPAIPVRPPAAPAGYRVAFVGRMGELQIRAMLTPCVGEGEARAASLGWGGDAFTVAVNAGSRAVLWSTAWDTEPSAARFEQALLSSGRCFPDPGGGSGHVVRDQAKVAFVRGLPEAAAPSAARELLGLSGEPPPPAPPLGDVRLHPVSAPLPRLRGVIMGSYYRSDLLDLTAVIPPGFLADPLGREAELTIHALGATGVLAVSDRIIGPRFNEEVLRSIADGLGAAFEGGLETRWSGTIELPLGRAFARQWAAAGGAVSVRALLVPVCDDTGAYVFAEMWRDDAQREVLDGWVRSFRHGYPGAPPICQELDPD